jgi:hypothetical protein
MPHGSPGQDLGASALGSGRFPQPDAAATSNVKTTTATRPLQIICTTMTRASAFVETTRALLPILSTQAVEVALPAPALGG